MTISNGRKTIAGLGLAASLLMSTPLAAQTITLSSQDGSIQVSGEFVDFSENIYLIRTALGELRLSAERVSCTGAACPTFDVVEADAVFVGSDTVGSGVMPLVLEGYAGFLDAEAELVATGGGSDVVATLTGESGFGEELVSYRVSATASADAFTALSQPGQQIGMSSRRITPTEARALREAGAGNMVSPDQEHIIAIDSIVVVTHPDNPVRDISLDDLERIYLGDLTNWSQLGGDNQPITVIDRDSSDGTRSVFVDRVLEGGARVSSRAVIAADNNEVARLVNQDRGAIGYTGFAFQRGARALNIINECGIAMTPDAFSARTEEYALQRRLYLYQRADTRSPQVTDFIDYVSSPDADDLIAKAGFIDLGVDRRSQPLDSERAVQLVAANVDQFERAFIRDMLGTMPQYDRLSTTFRFRTGSSRLDERAVIDMARLTSYLESQPQDSKVLIVGFTDDVGAFESNRVLAKSRAEQVREELLLFASGRLNGFDVDTVGYGEIAPSACNISDTGRAINRRVEVWIQSAG